ncbi:MAG TPA: glucose-6-phosphate isomerase family protein [Puia sp.]|nr:glucose-6-phosphate isomerase family protein [Puia sp.]
MPFDPGLDIQPLLHPLDFKYGADSFGPSVERRRLDDIRASLRDPRCTGPDIVYAIAMDTGKPQHKKLLQEKMLLYGIVTYAAGRLGREPVRSQGHIHKISTHSGWSPPEVYEIWAGKAIIYMQEFAEDDPGRCFAIYAGPGDVVVVPPGWAHATISADPTTPLTFGAWCDREYGFLYDKVRAHGGLAWFPLLDQKGDIFWEPNPAYKPTELQEKSPADYSQTLGIKKNVPIYTQFEKDPGTFQFVSQPGLKKEVWKNYIP